jgi:hypothetical protein
VEVLPVDSPVIVGEACVERIDELSYEEERDRLHLERKVERAFYEAGKALRELRDRRLYRSTHPTFEGYCRDRFGFGRRHPYQLIDAATVVDNLIYCANDCSPEKMCADSAQNPDGEMCANGLQILPTSEYQVRPLVKLEPDRQWEAWQEAVEEAGGKVPSGRIVKDIVERMTADEQPTRAHHLSLVEGGLVEIRCPSSTKIHARLGRIASVREKTVEVWVRDLQAMTMVKHTLKHHQVEVVPLENEPGCFEVARRIDALRSKGLEPIDLEILELLDRAVVLTPVELGYLEAIEGRVL